MTASQFTAPMPPPFASGIYAILDTGRLGLSNGAAIADARDLLCGLACAASAAGVVAIQLRLKALPLGDPVRVATATAVRAALAGAIPLIVNDDLAAAAMSGCGVHVGQSDTAVAAGRMALGASACVGLSTHSVAQVAAAQQTAASYLGFGPVRMTASKAAPEPVTGWAALADACALSQLAVVAIGGLQTEDAPLARAAGAHAMAVIGAWLGPVGAPHSVAQAHAAAAALAKAWASAPQ